MSFLDILNRTGQKDILTKIYNPEDEKISSLMNKENFGIEDLPYLLSPKSTPNLPYFMEIAKRKTLNHFGKTIKMFAPLYLSSYCVNSCEYCSFNNKINIERKRLSIDEAQRDADILYGRGFRHILLVAGEDPKNITIGYLSELILKLKERFAAVSIEIDPRSSEEYRALERSGLDGLTIYQETYDKYDYQTAHRMGNKRDFDYRLETPERGGKANFREIGIGALLGLSNWRTDGYFLGLHASYLIKTFWRSQIVISFPRIRQIEAPYQIPNPVSDKELIQLISAMRLVFPHVDLTLSTRESAALRDKLIGIGITRMSAGSSTIPGGYSEKGAGIGKGVGQFQISDQRTVEEILQTISVHGYDPVFKDWESIV